MRDLPIASKEMIEKLKVQEISVLDCLMCSKRATVLGIFMPDIPKQYGGYNKIPYGLCEDCIGSPVVEVEDSIFLSLIYKEVS
jgi:hypothetical protein